VTDHRLLVAALLVVESLYYVFARLLLPLVPPAAGAMYMMVVGTVQIALIMRGRLDWTVLRRHRWLFLAIGLLVGVNTNMGFVAVAYVDPGTAALLSRTSILFGVGLGVAWLGERLRGLEVAGAAIAVAGVLAISFQPGDYLRWGALIVIGSTALYAVHSALVKRFAGDIPFGEFMFFRVASVAVVVTALAVAQRAVVWPGPVAWFWIAVAAGVNVVVSRGVYYLALRRLDMSFLTIVLTLTPVVTWLWSIMLFGGRPTAVEIAGGVATLAGVLLVTASRAGLLGKRLSAGRAGASSPRPESPARRPLS
jgi:drug/metabolite transporter (DMT)-like permease